MAPTTPTTDRPARIAVAKYAPFAFMGLKAVFVVLVIVTWVTERQVNVTAAIVALSAIPPIIITWLNRLTVCDLAAENADLKRDLRTADRLRL